MRWQQPGRRGCLPGSLQPSSQRRFPLTWCCLGWRQPRCGGGGSPRRGLGWRLCLDWRQHRRWHWDFCCGRGFLEISPGAFGLWFPSTPALVTGPWGSCCCTASRRCCRSCCSGWRRWGCESCQCGGATRMRPGSVLPLPRAGFDPGSGLRLGQALRLACSRMLCRRGVFPTTAIPCWCFCCRL